MEDAFEMAAPEVNFLVLLLWVAMAALLIVLIAMGGGARTGAGGACAIRARITIDGNRIPEAPDSAGARIHDV